MTVFDARNREGWLTADSLKDGAREQYAVARSYGRCIVELTWSPDGEPGVGTGPWQVTCTIDGANIVRTRHETLNRARKRYKALVKAHP